MAHQDRGPFGRVEVAVPARFVISDPVAQRQVALVELGTDHLEPGIDEDLALGAVVVLIKSGVAVMEAEEPRRHARLPGELDRRVGEPEGLLAEPDRPSFAGPRVEPAAGDQDEDQDDTAERPEPGEQARRGQAPGGAAEAAAGTERRPSAAAHSAKFQAVIAPTTAAN